MKQTKIHVQQILEAIFVEVSSSKRYRMHAW